MNLPLLILPQSHPFSRRESVGLEEARGQDWITGRPHQDTYKELSAATRSVGYAPQIRHYSQDLPATAALVAAVWHGDRVGCLGAELSGSDGR
ncbi:LysR substrate-binding domain-containing protein [Nesterenkonia sp. CF4.4]|uniref:LysR substrate-binding domain-containing protein n=1 Tax=Nesterenkonia sp. CF4.4 TaxID=3373079 RepID=UPI003EE5BD3C